MEALPLPLLLVVFEVVRFALLLGLLGPALLDPRCSEVPSRADGAALDRCELCVVGVLALAEDPDPAAELDVLDPALVVFKLPSAPLEEEEAREVSVTVSSESADVLDRLDLADSVVSPPSVLPAEESHGDGVSWKSPSDRLDPAVAAALLGSTFSGEEESRTVMVLLESSSGTVIVLIGSSSCSSASCISTSSVSGTLTHSPTLLDLESCEEEDEAPARCVSKSESRIPGERKTLSRVESDIWFVCRAMALSSGRTMVMLQLVEYFLPSISPLRFM
jgi:hypothetical protein